MGELLPDVDLSAVVEVLAGGRGGLLDRRRLFALAWGVFPSSQWLESHGWAVSACCPGCGGIDDTRHSVIGCPAEVPDEVVQLRTEAWREAI